MVIVDAVIDTYHNYYGNMHLNNVSHCIYRRIAWLRQDKLLIENQYRTNHVNVRKYVLFLSDPTLVYQHRTRVIVTHPPCGIFQNELIWPFLLHTNNYICNRCSKFNAIQKSLASTLVNQHTCDVARKKEPLRFKHFKLRGRNNSNNKNSCF